MDINIIDGIVILILLFFAIRSFMNGLIQEVLHLASWVAAIYATMYFYPHFIPFFEPYIESKSIVIGVSVATAFVVFLAVFYFLSFVINRILSFSALTPLNQSLGFLFGIGKGLLVVSVFYMGLVGIVQDRMPKMVTDAKTEPFIRTLSNGLAKTFPDEFGTMVLAKMTEVGKAVANDPVIRQELKQGERALKDAVKPTSGANDKNQNTVIKSNPDTSQDAAVKLDSGTSQN